MSTIATRDMGEILDTRLDNGLRVVIEPMHDVSSAAAGFMARAGSRDEPAAWAGVSHFLEHMCFKGTRKRPWQQITIDFDNMGSYYNAFTSREHTFYFGWVRRADIAVQIELLADMVRPTLPAEEFDMEKKVVLEEIAMSDDDLDRHMYELLHEKVFAGHGLAWPVLGYKETVAKLARQDMADYHAQYYSPSNMVLLVAGNVDPDAILRTATKVTADWSNVGQVPRRQAPVQLHAGRAVQVMDRFKQQCVATAVPTGSAGTGEETIEAIASILGGENSRFFWNITQKGISPRAAVWGVTYADCGFQLLYAFGEPEKAEQMCESIRHEAERMQADGIRPEELQRFKNRRRTGIAVDGEAAYNRLMQMMQDIDYHDRARTLDQRLAEVDAVTVEGLHEHLQRYPVTSEGYFVSVGPRNWPAL
jgi:predicted Zn-dependent peptidase